MNAEVVQTLITSVGFPIFCVLALGWFIWKAYNNIMERSEKREDRLYTVIKETQEQMDKVTNINGEFAEIMRAYKSDLESIKEDVSEIKQHIRKE